MYTATNMRVVSLALLLGTHAALVHASSEVDDFCLDVKLVDSYGDGWNGAEAVFVSTDGTEITDYVRTTDNNGQFKDFKWCNPKYFYFDSPGSWREEISVVIGPIEQRYFGSSGSNTFYAMEINYNSNYASRDDCTGSNRHLGGTKMCFTSCFAPFLFFDEDTNTCSRESRCAANEIYNFFP